MSTNDAIDPKLMEVHDIVVRTWPTRILDAWKACADFDFYNTRNIRGIKAVCSEFLDSPRDIAAVLAAYGFVQKFSEPGEYIHVLDLVAGADDSVGELIDDKNIQAGLVLWRFMLDFDGPVPSLGLPLPPAHTQWKQRSREIVARLREPGRRAVDQYINEHCRKA